MRTVHGPTDRVVVVGAGLGGLATAIRLAAAGREVTLLEREDHPGGRAGRLSVEGYEFDTGPTVLTMPSLLDDLLGTVGEDLDSWLPLTRLDPAYRAHFPDGSTLDVIADTARMAGEVSRVCGSREADGYLRFVDYARELWRLERNDFIDRNIDGPRDLVTANLWRLAGKGGFGRLQSKVDSFFTDPRTRRIFSFQAMYAGVAPHQALALYAVIAYLDSVAGVYFPAGGIHAVSRALADVATKHGVNIVYSATVSRVEVSSGRATGVVTADGRRFAADAVVLNPDLPVAYRDLLPSGTRWRNPLLGKLRYSPSCVVLHVGSRQAYGGIAHHNIHFGRAWRETFDEVINQGRLMSDPSILVTNPTRTDPSLAPEGRQTYYVLAPTPNLNAPLLDWRGSLAGTYRSELIATLEQRGYLGFGDGIEVSRFVTPADWADQGMAAGTPFAAAHTMRQTGPFRPGNLHPTLSNVVFVGSGTQPGVGVPMVLISGRLAAERITGSVVNTREQHLVELVSDDGSAIGTTTVDEAHRAPGQLHRAFSVLLLDADGRLLLQQRAAVKTRFALRWANACCGHPGPGEPVTDAADRRLAEELGVTTVPLKEVGVYLYQADDPDSGRVEFEYDHVLIGSLPADHPLAVDPAEVAAVEWVQPAELAERLGRFPHFYAPWLTGVVDAWRSSSR